MPQWLQGLSLLNNVFSRGCATISCRQLLEMMCKGAVSPIDLKLFDLKLFVVYYLDVHKVFREAREILMQQRQVSFVILMFG